MEEIKELVRKINEITGFDITEDTMIEEFYKQLVLKWKESNTKHYIGESKWSLYQYIINVPDNDNNTIHIRCGNYAWDKLNKIITKDESRSNVDFASGSLNGEDICLYRNYKFDKRKIAISNHKTACENGYNQDWHYADINYPDDIVLYYA